MLLICLACTAAYAPGAPKCPQCGSTDCCEQGSAEHVAWLSKADTPAPAETKKATK